MKKIFKLIGIIAIVALIGFSMTACPVPPEPDVKEDPALTGTITISPSGTVDIGTKLTATYSGSESVNFQWKKDGSNVGTASTTTPNEFTPTAAGSYKVTVSATGYKSMDSNTVTVTDGSSGPGGSDWVAVTNSTFGTSDIRGIANGNGKFVAVGEGGKMAYSADGVTWTATNVTGTFDSTDRIDSIAYVNNMFVAVSYNTSDYTSKTATSADGVTWTVVTNFPSDIERIFYGDGKFIAVGNYRWAISTDGVTWPDWTRDSEISIYSIAYGNGKFVAVGSGTSKMKISTDGETWTKVDVTSTFGTALINSIAYGNNMFVAVGGTGKMATSTDGTTWTLVADSAFGPYASIGKIIYGNNTFVAVGLDLVNSSMVSKVVTSTDGTTWTAANVTSIFVDPGNLYVAYGSSKFVIVGQKGKMAYLPVTSTEDPDLEGTITIDPNTNVTLGMELTATYSGTEIVSYQWKKGATNVGTDADTFTPTEVGSYTVTVSATGYKSKTSNPVTVAKPAWTLAANSTFGTTYINGIAYGKGTFVAVGGASKMAYSSDGKNWTAIPPGLNDGTTFGTASGGTTIHGIAYGNNTFVAVGNSGKMATSPDGITWTKVASNPFLSNYDFILGIAYGNNMFVAVGEAGKIATSPDGTTWTSATQSTFVGTEYIEAVAYGNGTFVAVGVYGKIVTSTNGTTWTGVTNSTFGSSTGNDHSSDIYAITYKNGMFIAGGANGKMATSTNGTTWTAVDTGTAFEYDYYDGTTRRSAISAIAYGNGMFVAGGGYYNGRRATSPDGTTWTAVTDNLFDRSDIEAIAFGNNMFVAGGGDGKMAYLYAPPIGDIDLDGTIAISPTANVTTGMELTAKYTGSEEVSYQWKKGTTVVGTDSNKFTPTEVGSYTVTVSATGYNSKTSAPVNVVILDLPGAITITPSGSAYVGTQLSATYSGTESVSFQWMKDGSNIGTASTTKPNTYTPTEPGSYTVTVSAVGYNGKTSDAVTVKGWIAVTDSTFGTSLISSIAYGNNTYVAGENYGKMATSPDGITWTAVTDSTFDPTDPTGPYVIAYGYNMFIAGGSGKMVTSSDGTTWTAVTNSTFGYDSILGITFDNGQFVAVGSGGKMAISSFADNGSANIGKNWTAVGDSTFGTAYLITAIAYGNSKFVAVGYNYPDYNGKMAVSTNANGKTWTAVTDSTFGTDMIYGITYGNGKFVAVGDKGKMATSPDGTTWTAVTDSKFGTDGIYNITYGNGKFVAVGANGKMATSPDGTTWTAEVNNTFGTDSINKIIYGNGKFVAVGANGKIAYLLD